MTAFTPNDPAARPNVAMQPAPMQPAPMQQLQPHTTYVQQPIYMMQQPSQPRGASITSMVLGICSVFFGWTFLVPLIGLILGIAGLRREPAGKGFAWTGVILNGIMLLGWLLVIVAVGGSIVAMLGLGGAVSLAGV